MVLRQSVLDKVEKILLCTGMQRKCRFIQENYHGLI